MLLFDNENNNLHIISHYPELENHLERNQARLKTGTGKAISVGVSH